MGRDSQRAGDDFTVYAYLNDGSVYLVDIKPFLKKGTVFEPLMNPKTFKDKLTVIGNTIAWDMLGNRNEYECIDIDTFYIFNCSVVPDVPTRN